MLELKKTTNYGISFRNIRSRVYSFGLGGKFLFASIMTGEVSGQLCIIRYPRAKHPLFQSVWSG